ncbi:MAG: hypothetical protein A2W19_12855 [Spirochaetes bacterium RBG_16_49_21]|nr:MAG: hypothetical protein A2W19_12855 [Spirochaetes bacterium RBG_16_49_21]
MKQAERFYRNFTETPRWNSFRVRVETSDLYIRAHSDLSGPAERIIRKLREEVRYHIERQSSFLYSFTPVERLERCPEIITLMYYASEKAGVGPMAAVAGAVAQLVGLELAQLSEEIIVENGGDIWMKITKPAIAALYPGGYAFSAVAVKLRPEQTPCGICTSSARIGPSFSYGKADAVTVISPDAALSDAIATEACNRVKHEEDMAKAASYAMGCGASGAVIIFRDRLVALGAVELADPMRGEYNEI